MFVGGKVTLRSQLLIIYTAHIAISLSKQMNTKVVVVIYSFKIIYHGLLEKVLLSEA